RILSATKSFFSRINQSVKDALIRTANDYKAVAQESAENIKKRPIRSIVNTMPFVAAFYFYKTAPKEQSYLDSVVEASNDLLLVGEHIRNPNSDKHVQKIMWYSARGMLRYFNLKLFTVVYYSDYSEEERTYLSQCKYTNPTWTELPSRIVDIGILNHWWRLRWVMTDFDVNFNENSKEFDHLYN
uniref:Uncharacterized protein n=1 Tax=Ciona savignyi TaxID=51511 RepID=H2ZAD5_CIOSA